MSFGLILVIVGALWFLDSLGVINSGFWSYIWPVVLILFGLDLLQRDEPENFAWWHSESLHHNKTDKNTEEKAREVVDEQ